MSKIMEFLKKIFEPTEAEKQRRRLKKAYKDAYNKVYYTEREKHLIEKAQKDAREKATKDADLRSFFGFIGGKQI